MQIKWLLDQLYYIPFGQTHGLGVEFACSLFEIASMKVSS